MSEKESEESKKVFKKLRAMLHKENTVVIPFSRSKEILLILACIAFVLVSLWLWTIADNQVRQSPVFIKIISVFGVSFFGLGFILGTKKLFDKRPGLIIDENGFQDNTSTIGSGRFIAWRNINRFEVVTIKGTKVLLIFVNNANEMIYKESTWKQKFMRFSEQEYGTPISIGSNILKIEFIALTKLLSERHSAYND